MPGFGEDDPRAGVPGWEGVVSAAAGLYFPPRIMGLPDNGEPVYTAVPLPSSYAAFIAGHSIVAALVARHQVGRGQRIEVPLFHAALQILGSGQLINGKPPGLNAPRTPLRLIKRHLCADGRYVDISPPWRGVDFFVQHFLPRDVKESGLLNDSSPEAAAELARIVEELFKTRTAAEWEAACQEIGTGIALCQTTEEWLHDQHATDSRCVIPLADPEVGATMQAGYPVTLSKTPPEVQGPRRALDADRRAVLAELGEGSANGATAPNVGVGAGSLSRGLEGFRAIDTSQVLASPTACRVLAEYGAEVIKINNPRTEENFAGAMAHTCVNNGKRTMLLDLKSPAGRDILWRLVEQADVFHQNFARPTVTRLGIDEAEMRRHRPDIVFSSVNTHADGGFRGTYRGHEELGQAISGMENRLGGDGRPERAGWPVCDYATGHLSAFAILLALFHRLRTGEGQHVQASLSQTGTYLQIPFMLDFEGRVWDEPRGIQARGWSLPCTAYTRAATAGSSWRPSGPATSPAWPPSRGSAASTRPRRVSSRPSSRRASPGRPRRAGVTG